MTGALHATDTLVICIERFSVGFDNPTPAGKVLPADDPRVQRAPEFFRYLGPPVETVKEVEPDA